MHIRPNALCLHNLNRHVPHNNHFHESNDKQYCMLRQYIAGGPINPPLLVVREINWCKHDATTPSGCACHPSTGGELAVRYFFNSPTIQPPRQATPATPPQEGNWGLRKLGGVERLVGIKMVGTQKPSCQAAPATLPQEGELPCLDTIRPPRQADA